MISSKTASDIPHFHIKKVMQSRENRDAEKSECLVNSLIVHHSYETRTEPELGSYAL